MNTDSPWIDAVLEQASGRFDPWLSCDACFDRSDEVVEDLVERWMPLPADFAAHLRGCSACRDEATALTELVATECGTDAASARVWLETQLELA